MVKKVQSDFLFAQPGFASGVASVIDLWGELSAYNMSTTTAEADENAIAADWFVVGQDIYDALQQHASEGDRVAA
jgi:hypothetical protein